MLPPLLKPTAAASAPITKSGAFERKASKYRDRLTAQVPLEDKGRYTLIVSFACPWACRSLSVLHLKGIEGNVNVKFVHPTWQRTRADDADGHCGWVFATAKDERVERREQRHLLRDEALASRVDGAGEANRRGV